MGFSPAVLAFADSGGVFNLDRGGPIVSVCYGIVMLAKPGMVFGITLVAIGVLGQRVPSLATRTRDFAVTY